MRLTTPASLTALALTLAAGCAAGVDSAEDLNNNPPLADVDELLYGAPKADEIPRRGYKLDHILPQEHATLLGLQSPVRSQGRRGVCSIFSTVGLMEHLYIVEGTVTDPDFSEQYLQWSAKFEVNSFPSTSGSNATYNLRAISDFGIVEEAVWPYEPEQWNTANDPACDGEDDQPTLCYTNGHPTDAMKAAPKWELPRSQWLHHSDIKSHIASEGTGVIAGMTFFYQSWNHRLSDLPTNSTSWNQGYVIYPSDEDKSLSLAKRAGHSIVLIGWDDNLELPVLDDNGQHLVDADGDVVTQKGCYIFKNSWGTQGFGIDSAWGPGYGCISYDYIEEYASLRTAGLPDLATEICGDGLDNDSNGATDCDDAACTEDASCQGTVLSFDGGSVDIPDNNPVGASSTITVADGGTIAGIAVDVDITHTYQGDLRISLHRGSEAVVLRNRSGGSKDDIVETYEIDDFDGQDLAGDWRLVIVDAAGVDVGTLNSWTLRATVQ